MRIRRKNRIKQSWDDNLFDFLCNLFLILFVITVFYPIYFVLVASFSDPYYVNNGALLLYPKGFNLKGYEAVVTTSKIWTYYGNTILYTVGGVLVGLAAIMPAGYALSRKDLWGKSLIMKLLVFTMYFGGGLIPTFLVISNLGLINTRFLMIILGSVSVYNTIVVRSFTMSNIPDELYEAAVMDGCGHCTFFAKVVLPLSKAIIAVMVLYIAVGHWNSYFNAMVYMIDSEKNPLQLYLREQLLLISKLGETNPDHMDPMELVRLQQMAQMMKYSLIVVATAPILTVYPFIQKYFVKGVMVGSVKG